LGACFGGVFNQNGSFLQPGLEDGEYVDDMDLENGADDDEGVHMLFKLI
jgi:hypothetical protein